MSLFAPILQLLQRFAPTIEAFPIGASVTIPGWQDATYPGSDATGTVAGYGAWIDLDLAKRPLHRAIIVALDHGAHLSSNVDADPGPYVHLVIVHPDSLCLIDTNAQTESTNPLTQAFDCRCTTDDWTAL